MENRFIKGLGYTLFFIGVFFFVRCLPIFNLFVDNGFRQLSTDPSTSDGIYLLRFSVVLLFSSVFPVGIGVYLLKMK